MEKPWYKTRYLRVLLESHNISEWAPNLYEKFDAKKLVKTIADAGAEVAWIHACNLFGDLFYNTKIGYKSVVLGERDQVGEFVKECHKRDIKAVVYFCGLYDMRSYYEHPDWRIRYADGTWGSLGRYEGPWSVKSVCPNSPYREYLKRLVREIIENYDIDAFWLDMPFFQFPIKLHCYCQYCREKFKKRFGAEIPTEPDWNSKIWKEFIKWRYEAIHEYLEEIRDTVKSIKPNVYFYSNSCDIGLEGQMLREWLGPRGYEWSLGFDLAWNGEIDDWMCHDIHFPKEDTLRRSVYLRFFRHLGRYQPAEPAFSRNPPTYDATSVKSLTHMRMEASLAFANGMSVLFFDQINPDGTLYKEVWDRIGEVFSEAKSKKEWVVGSEPVNFAAVTFSQKSRDFYGKENPQNYTRNFFGICKALLECNVPFGVIAERHFKKLLPEFDVLVLPNTTCISEEEASMVREYVKKGGGLVATYEASLYNEWGEMRDNFLLCDVFGAKYLNKTESIENYVDIAGEHQVVSGINREMPLQHFGQQLKVKSEAKVFGYIVDPISPDNVKKVAGLSNPPFKRTESPALLINRFDRGRVVYLPNRLDAVLLERNLPNLRTLLRNAVVWAGGGKSPLEVDAPIFVEATILKQPEERRLIVHLVNCNPVDDLFSVHDVKVKIRVPEGFKIGDVYLAPSRGKLSYKVTEEIIEASVPELEMHEMVVVESA